jgi:hypothetical protein
MVADERVIIPHARLAPRKNRANEMGYKLGGKKYLYFHQCVNLDADGRPPTGEARSPDREVE